MILDCRSSQCNASTFMMMGMHIQLSSNLFSLFYCFPVVSFLVAVFSLWKAECPERNKTQCHTGEEQMRTIR